MFLNQSDDVPFMAEFPPDRRQFLLFPFQRLVIGSLLLLLLWLLCAVYRAAMLCAAIRLLWQQPEAEVQP